MEAMEAVSSEGEELDLDLSDTIQPYIFSDGIAGEAIFASLRLRLQRFASLLLPCGSLS